MSDYSTIFPPQTYSSSFYLNALTEGEKTVLLTDTDDDDDNESEDERSEKTSPILDCFIATMNKLYLVLIAFFSSCSSQTTNYISTSKPKNETSTNLPQLCFIEKSRRVRTFPTLQDYQGNKFSFDPRSPTYQGNIVKFSFTTIYTLSKNDFISFGSSGIMEIDLHNKEISFIESGAFISLFCLSKLDLSYNHLANLTEGSFEGLENLKELNLSHNKLGNIPDSGIAFLALKSLDQLDLSFNKIQALSKLSFMTLSNLIVLNLGHNKIKTIDDRVFNYLFALKECYLNDNLLVETFADKWKGLDNLTTLDVSNNDLTSFDTSANYSFYNLGRLNLSGNHLQFLNVYWIRKNFHKLKILDLANNSWFCEDFEAIKHGLVDLRIVIPREVTCHEIKTSSIKTTIPSTTVVTDSTTQFRDNYGAKILEQNNQILNLNKDITAAVDSLKSVLIVICFIIVIVVTVEVGIRMGCFRNWNVGGRGNNRGYLNSNEVESLGLISR